jgi:hypothetical protein
MILELSVLEAVALARAIAEFAQSSADADRREIVYAIRGRVLKKLDEELQVPPRSTRPGAEELPEIEARIHRDSISIDGPCPACGEMVGYNGTARGCRPDRFECPGCGRMARVKYS